MNYDDLYPSKYIKQGDVPEETVVTIRGLKIANVGTEEEPQNKPIIKFDEFEKPMVLNKTNGDRIKLAHGSDTAQWLGKKMILYVNPDISFGGETTGGLRLKPYKVGSPKGKAQGVDESDIPF